MTAWERSSSGSSSSSIEAAEKWLREAGQPLLGPLLLIPAQGKRGEGDVGLDA